MEVDESKKTDNSKIIDDLGYGKKMVDVKGNVLRQNFQKYFYFTSEIPDVHY